MRHSLRLNVLNGVSNTLVGISRCSHPLCMECRFDYDSVELAWFQADVEFAWEPFLCACLRLLSWAWVSKNSRYNFFRIVSNFLRAHLNFVGRFYDHLSSFNSYPHCLNPTCACIFVLIKTVPQIKFDHWRCIFNWISTC